MPPSSIQNKPWPLIFLPKMKPKYHILATLKCLLIRKGLYKQGCLANSKINKREGSLKESLETIIIAEASQNLENVGCWGGGRGF